MEAGGTFFAFRAGDVGGIFPACRYRGSRGCSLASVKRNAFYESGKNCTQGFGTGWERQPEGMGYGYGSRIRAGENGVRFRGTGRGDFHVPVRAWGIRMRNSSGLVEAFMTGKEKGVEREISIKQIRKQV